MVSDRPPYVSLIYILLVVGISFIFLGPSIGLALVMPFYDGQLVQDINHVTTPPNPQLFLALMVVQGCASFFGLIFFPWLYLRYIEKKSLMPFFRNEKEWWISVPLVMFIGILFLVTIAPVVEWNMNVRFPEWMRSFEQWARTQETDLEALTRFLTHFASVSDFALGMVVIALLPGIGEELVFRGFIQQELHRATKSIHVAIWISAVLFSAIHLQFFGFLPRMLLGALFGYLYYWSGNLLIPMVAHFFHNGFTLVMMYLYQQGTSPIDPESNEALPVPAVVTGGFGVIVLLYYFRKFYRQT